MTLSDGDTLTIFPAVGSPTQPFEIKVSGTVKITGPGPNDVLIDVYITSTANTTLTIEDLNIAAPDAVLNPPTTGTPGIAFADGSTNTLRLSGENTVTGGRGTDLNGGAAGVSVPDGVTLIINSVTDPGSLKVTGGSGGINGGGGAGIGGGGAAAAVAGGDGGTVKITGGSVEATGGNGDYGGGAGIGGGGGAVADGGTGCTVEITGGSLKATGGDGAYGGAGIGGGGGVIGGDGGTVKISGGSMQATGGGGGVAITKGKNATITSDYSIPVYQVKVMVTGTGAPGAAIQFNNPSIYNATADANGEAFCHLPDGDYKVTARQGTASGTESVTVNGSAESVSIALATPAVVDPPDPGGNDDIDTTVPVTGVTLSPSALSLTTGDTAKLSAAVAPTNATNKSVTWKSSDESVATVDGSGNVTAVAPGTCTITVTTASGGRTAVCEVTVAAQETPPPATKIEIDLSALDLEHNVMALEPGEPVEVTITGTPDGIKFTADGLPDGLTLTEDGRLTGSVPEEGEYEVTITATAPDGTTTTTTFTVKVVAGMVTATSSGGGCEAGAAGLFVLLAIGMAVKRRK